MIRYKLYVDRFAGLQEIIHQIEEAKTSITISTFYWRDGIVSDIILEKLHEATLNGVYVTIIIDGKLSKFIRSTGLKQFSSSSSSTLCVKYVGKNYLHSKFWLFDNTTLIVTSANISDKYYAPSLFAAKKLNMSNTDLVITGLPIVSVDTINLLVEQYISQGEPFTSAKSSSWEPARNIYSGYESLYKYYDDKESWFDAKNLVIFTGTSAIFNNMEYIIENDKEVDIICGYINHRMLNSMVKEDSKISLFTNSYFKLPIIDKIYKFYNCKNKLKENVSVFHLNGKVHEKYWNTSKRIFFGSANIDKLSKKNREIMVELIKA